jgi:hypothetical protein
MVHSWTFSMTWCVDWLTPRQVFPQEACFDNCWPTLTDVATAAAAAAVVAVPGYVAIINFIIPAVKALFL